MRMIDLSLTIAEETQFQRFPRSLVYGKPEPKKVIAQVVSIVVDQVKSCHMLTCIQHYSSCRVFAVEGQSR